jgi:hypothetical protein
VKNNQAKFDCLEVLDLTPQFQLVAFQIRYTYLFYLHKLVHVCMLITHHVFKSWHSFMDQLGKALGRVGRKKRGENMVLQPTVYQ